MSPPLAAAHAQSRVDRSLLARCDQRACELPHTPAGCRPHGTVSCSPAEFFLRTGTNTARAQTRRWREKDSNPRSPVKKNPHVASILFDLSSTSLSTDTKETG